MLIRLLIGLALFIWVLMAPLPYRLSLMQAAQVESRDARLSKEEFFSRQKVERTKSLPLSDPVRAQALADYALVAWQRLRYVEAANIFRELIANTHPQPNQYDPRFVGYLLNVAAICRDQNDLANARSYLQSILTYDRSNLPENDVRLGRDFNNLGLEYYLEASTKDAKAERTRLMQFGNEFYEKALAIYGRDSKNEQALANTLDNQYLLLRDLGETALSQAAKAKAEAIEAKLNRVCKAP